VLGYLTGCRNKMGCQMVKEEPYKSLGKGKDEILNGLVDSDKCLRMERKLRK